MSDNRILNWIDELPGVQMTDFLQRRDKIGTLIDKGMELVALRNQLCAQLDKKAEEVRVKAYELSCTLEGDAKAKWSVEQVEQAKCTAVKKTMPH